MWATEFKIGEYITQLLDRNRTDFVKAITNASTTDGVQNSPLSQVHTNKASANGNASSIHSVFLRQAKGNGFVLSRLYLRSLYVGSHVLAFAFALRFRLRFIC